MDDRAIQMYRYGTCKQYETLIEQKYQLWAKIFHFEIRLVRYLGYGSEFTLCIREENVPLSEVYLSFFYQNAVKSKIKPRWASATFWFRK